VPEPGLTRVNRLRSRGGCLDNDPSAWFGWSRWFSALTTKKLQRSAHRSVKELAADIWVWVNTWNDNPTPFRWHKPADEILQRLAGYCRRHQHRKSQRFNLTGQ
jgi:hypothetical protein